MSNPSYRFRVLFDCPSCKTADALCFHSPESSAISTTIKRDRISLEAWAAIDTAARCEQCGHEFIIYVSEWLVGELRVELFSVPPGQLPVAAMQKLITSMKIVDCSVAKLPT